jgi:hypothetical protein
MANDSKADMRLVYEGLRLGTIIRTFKKRIEEAKALLARREEVVRTAERQLAQINEELHKQGFHDIGHARQEFETKIVDGHRVLLTPGELDPEVAFRLRDAERYTEDGDVLG